MSRIDFESRKLCDLKQFAKIYKEQVITEWSEAYISYQSLKQYLDFLKMIYDDYHFKKRSNLDVIVEVLMIQPQVKQQIDKTVEYLDMRVQDGWQKAQKFVNWKLTQILHYWGELMDITVEHHMEEEQKHQTYDKKVYIKRLMKILYAQTICLKIFISLNIKIKQHCQQAKKHYAEPLIKTYQQGYNNKYDYSLKQTLKVNESIDSISNLDFSRRKSHTTQQLQIVISEMQAIEEGIKTLFYSSIYSNQYSSSNLNKYNVLTIDTDSSNENYFFLGLYLGLGLFIFIALGLVLILDVLEFDSDDGHISSMTYIFPMFRGIGLLILYIWCQAWNVYGFLKFKINFRTILEYGSHFSNPFQIMKKAGFFTLIFCLMLFLYLIGLQYNLSESHENNHVPIEYTPFLVWLIFLGYNFFPSKQLFNPKGRFYFYRLLKKMLLSPWVKMGFVLSFATDQAVSFIVPIKDFAYTVCFYGSDFTLDDVRKCIQISSFDGVIISYIVALVPLMLRLIQCFNQARQASGKFFGHLQMWNFFKYLASINTSTISFMSSFYPNLFIPFIFCSIFSTSYSYYWDLKYDWGLLQKNSKYFLLRNYLCYKNPYIYYVVMLLNLIFRCSWTLTISPSVIQLIPKTTILPLVTGLIQIIRRCIWNFFRIQKEHVINTQSFIVVKEKPEDSMKHLRSKMDRKKSFQTDEHDLDVQYSKVTDLQFLQQLKKTLGYDLPRIDSCEIEKAKEEFLEYNRTLDLDKSRVAKKQIKKNINYGMKKNYFAL